MWRAQVFKATCPLLAMMTHARTVVVLLLWTGVVLAGCAGGNSGPNAADAVPESGTGVLAGLVTDDEARPVADARVQAPAHGLNATSDADGTFRLEDVPAGNVTIVVTHPEFENHSRHVEVVADTEVTLTLALVPLPTEEAFFELFPFAGFQQCMWYTPAFKSGCGYPYTALFYTAHDNGMNLSQYGAPSDVFDNQYRYNFSVRPEHTGIVSELVWVAATDAAKYYSLELSCAWYDPVVDDCVPPGETTWDPQNTYAVARGISPLRIEWEHERPDWLPWVMSRAYLSADVNAPVGAALEQKVEMFNTVFYGGPVPEGYRAAPAP